jgi:hypothetical protein
MPDQDRELIARLRQLHDAVFQRDGELPAIESAAKLACIEAESLVTDDHMLRRFRFFIAFDCFIAAVSRSESLETRERMYSSIPAEDLPLHPVAWGLLLEIRARYLIDHGDLDSARAMCERYIAGLVCARLAFTTEAYRKEHCQSLLDILHDCQPARRNDQPSEKRPP